MKIYNNKQIFNLLEKRLTDKKSSNNAFSILLFDIDNFKLVNYEYSHLIGDELLNIIEKRFMQSVVKDIISRFGGDEYVIISQIKSKKELLAYANQLRFEISNYPFYISSGEYINLTISCGATICNNEDDGLSLFNRARLALHYAKQHQGKNKNIKLKNNVFVL